MPGGITILGLGSLLSERSSRLTFPELQSMQAAVDMSLYFPRGQTEQIPFNTSPLPQLTS